MREQLKDLQREYDAIKTRESGLADKKSLLVPKVVVARRQLREAQGALDTLADPPPWFNRQRGQVSPDTLRELERRARRMIRDLMG
jgi:hypothetical protein